MDIKINTALSFKRKLKPREESEYSAVLNDAKKICGNNGKSILIVPSTSLPNETGVGNLGTKESEEFFDFAKKYWGINEIQLLPTGQYHLHSGNYPMYSGTSIDLGTHMIDIKRYATPEEYQSIVNANDIKDKVNFKNVLGINTPQDIVLEKIYDRMTPFQKTEFEKFKAKNESWLENKALFRVLRDDYKTANYKIWNSLDRNLFDNSVVSEQKRNERINELYEKNAKKIDLYKFKQYLADESLREAKAKLNAKGLKLDGDLICGFSYDEVWANPRAFHKDCSIGWSLPALNLESAEGEKLLRLKTKLYAQRFDGARIDASWVYVSPNVINTKTRQLSKKDYADKYLDIIDEEFKKVKGENYDLKNIMHEFVANRSDFDIYSNGKLKPYVESRVKVYTSQYINDGWGTNDAYLKRGWNPELFLFGATNHDSQVIDDLNTQKKVLGKILKIPKEKLEDPKEFQKAKLAEPMSAYNNMIFFMNALGIKGFFKGYDDNSKNYNTMIAKDYEARYFEALQKGEAFNPMDALEKTFVAKGLDKENPKLFKKIVKYREILDEAPANNKKSLALKIGIGLLLTCAIGYVIYKKVKKTAP